MLQHNVDMARIAGRADARNAHLAHAAVVGGHLLCCGAPIALALLATGAGVSIGVSAARLLGSAHSVLHAHELWLLAASALMVALGAVLEIRAHRGRRISAFFALSLLCFALNAGLIWEHRDGSPGPEASSPIIQLDGESPPRLSS